LAGLLVEIDRGTMPISRSDLAQSSFERKMLGYLTAYADGLHERKFGWKTFRVLTVSTDGHRLRSMLESLRHAQVARSPGPGLFWFALRDELHCGDPLAQAWHDGAGRTQHLV
jgi:hypothetical protein